MNLFSTADYVLYLGSVDNCNLRGARCLAHLGPQTKCLCSFRPAGQRVYIPAEPGVDCAVHDVERRVLLRCGICVVVSFDRNHALGVGPLEYLARGAHLLADAQPSPARRARDEKRYAWRELCDQSRGCSLNGSVLARGVGSGKCGVGGWLLGGGVGLGSRRELAGIIQSPTKQREQSSTA